jgi:hypothetical protein
MLKQRQTRSGEVTPDGAIKSAHIHTPITQLMDISSEERRRTILTIKGIFHKGMTIEATKPIFSTIFILSFYGI